MKKSFILHIDSLEVLNELSKEQIAELFIAIKDYNKGVEPILTGLMKAIFVPFKNQFDRDNEKYKNIAERNKYNGSKGGRPKNIIEKYPKENENSHFVYLIQDVTTNEYKIGETRNLKNRIWTIKRPTSYLKVITYAQSKAYYCQQKEKEIKQYFKNNIISGDWLNLQGNEIETVIDMINDTKKTQWDKEIPKIPDNDNDNDSVNDSDSDSDSDSVNDSKKDKDSDSKKDKPPKNPENDFSVFSKDIIKIMKKTINLFPEIVVSRLTDKDKWKWTDEVRKLNEIDNYSYSDIEKAIRHGRSDIFWKENFLSMRSLRTKGKDGIMKIVKILENEKKNTFNPDLLDAYEGKDYGDWTK